MDMRLIPLSAVVDTFPRLVRDLARDQDKDVNFEIDGRDIELDRTILTEIRDPLVHILRNAVDHGIEPPDKREAAGKPRTGNIELRARRERDHVNIVVEDDGAGIDADALREKAVDEGVKTPEEVKRMDDDEARELVFHPGFSTNEEVTDVSGRGVGMDVVRTTVKELDGSVTLDSTPGEGSRFEIRLPVTVAIVRVMFVEVNDTEYGIPIKNIAEVSRAANIETVHKDEVVRHDGDIYPVIRLEEVLETDGQMAAATDGGADAEGGGAGGTGGFDFGEGDDAGEDGMLVRIREENRPVALHCDEVLHQEEVVVKPLEGILSGIPGLSGTAVLGDGDVVTILDVETLGEDFG
jgi:two-component system chemotaxis sensor kinase CheA